MTEEKTKKRGWVKNVAIVFLAVLLVLTFFSSTIMNHSLPEVAVQTAGSGTINTQVRGTGTITAVETYQVKIDEQRTVKSVEVTTGTEVAPGDLLITLEEPKSTGQNGTDEDAAQAEYEQELKQYEEQLKSARDSVEAAQDELAALERAYEQALITYEGNFNYASTYRTIEKTREQLADYQASADEAQERLKEVEAAYSAAMEDLNAAYAEAKTAFDKATSDQSLAQAQYNVAEKNLEEVQQGTVDSSALEAATRARDEAKKNYNEAETAYQTALLEYGDAYEELMDIARGWIEYDYKETTAENYDKDHKLYKTGEDGGTYRNPEDKWWAEYDSLKEAGGLDAFYHEKYSSVKSSQENQKLSIYFLAAADRCKAGNGGTIPTPTDPSAFESTPAEPEPEEPDTQVEDETVNQDAQLASDSEGTVAVFYAAAVYAEGWGEGDDERYAAAYTAVTSAKSALDSAKSSYDSANAAYEQASNAFYEANRNNTAYISYKTARDNAKEALDVATEVTATANEKLENAQKALTSCEETYEKDSENAKSDYERAMDGVKQTEESLEDLLFNQEQTEIADERQQRIDEMNFQSQRDGIEKQKEEIAELEEELLKLQNTPPTKKDSGNSGEGTVVNEIRAQVYGVISQVSITAGNTTSAGDTLLTIEIPDRGYEVQFTVSVDQARRLSVGDMAELSNRYWWGSEDISAQLVSMKTDPKNPQQNRILVFSVTGSDVESGSSLTLSIGARSSSYELVVPKSAVREDSNGSFVYMVEAKSSPVGNRYIARRVDVEVKESDDLNSAVSGAIASGDYVITTSTAPIEDGMYVRLPEN